MCQFLLNLFTDEGKSSQVPQFLLEENMEPIVCTQPKHKIDSTAQSILCENSSTKSIQQHKIQAEFKQISCLNLFGLRYGLVFKIDLAP